MVEHNLAKVRVAGSSPVFRSRLFETGSNGGIGRHEGLKIPWPLRLWGFKSPFEYKKMIQQTEFRLTARKRGFHLVTEEIKRALPSLPKVGVLHLFIKHTSAGLSINENAAPDVRSDLNAFFDHLAPERERYYTHNDEGDDDMPAHAKSSLTGVSLTIPITNGQLNLGIWQGIYLCEFRNHASSRAIVATIMTA